MRDLASGTVRAGSPAAGPHRLTAQAQGRNGPPRGARKLLGLVLLLGVWALGSAQGWIPEAAIPGPWVIVASFADLVADRTLPEAMLISLQRVAIGLAIGLVIGVGLAVATGLSRFAEDLFDAPMQMLRTIPWPGLIPLLIIWFGIDEAPKVALVAFAVTFPLYLNVYAGIRTVDMTLVEAARTLGLGRAALIRHVMLPGALPSALVGLRWALGSAWLALVFSETVNAQAGIGYLITLARESYRTDVIIVGLVVYAFLGLAADVIVRGLERWLLSWQQAFSGT